MKKSISVIFVLAALLCIFSATSAMAGWSNWYSQDVPQGNTFTTYFLPLQAGNHKIAFQNDAGYYNGGTMESCWASNTNYVWSCWAVSDVLSYERQQNLYAGSDDIIFKFIFTNTSPGTRTFFYRFYTD